MALYRDLQLNSGMCCAKYMLLIVSFMFAVSTRLTDKNFQDNPNFSEKQVKKIWRKSIYSIGSPVMKFPETFPLILRKPSINFSRFLLLSFSSSLMLSLMWARAPNREAFCIASAPVSEWFHCISWNAIPFVSIFRSLNLFTC